MQIRVLVIDSQPLARLGLNTAAEKDGRLEIVGTAETGAEGLTLFRKLQPDVTVVNLRLSDFCAADDLGLFFEIDPDAKIVVVAEDAGDAEISSTIRHGASGFVENSIPIEELLDAISTVNSGSVFIQPSIRTRVSNTIFKEQLTRTETEVLRKIVGGMSNKEIALALDISQNTVKTHVRHIFEKLGVADRTSATVTAIKRGLVRLDI